MTPTTARRVVTVVFADLVDFTTLAERLDPEDVATIQDAYFNRARDAIEGRGGRVEKFIGDAVVGSFGVDLARGDESARATAAGLAIIAGVGQVAEDLGLEPDGLRVRVGVNTGEVLVTTLTDGSWRLTGDPVNVAARLQTAAAPGRVLVGPDTALAIESTFVVDAAGELDLKGKAERIRAWHVVKPRAVPASAEGRPRRRGPMVGRDDELRALDAMLGDDAATRSWLVVAPPGAGRSRLAAEWSARAAAAGHAVWAAKPSEPRVGYEPVSQLLRAALAIPGKAMPDRAVVVERLRRSGRIGRRAELAADHTMAVLAGDRLEADPGDLYGSWIAVLDTADAGPRRIWVIDDVHVASRDTLAFLRHALAAGGDPNRAVLLTASPVLLTEVGADPFPRTRILHLEPLDDESVRRLIAAVVDNVALPATIIDGLAAASGGNPLFIEEVTRVWLQTGVLTRSSAGDWTFGPTGDDLHLPATVQAIYQGELDSLEDAARRVLTVGSVPGLSFPVASLSVLGVDRSDGSLAELAGVGLLNGPHDGVADLPAYTYHHALLRDVAYATLTRSQRAGLHLRFAAWIDEVASGTEVDALVGLQLAAAHANAPAFGPLADGRSKDELAVVAADRLERAASRRLASEPESAGDLIAMSLDLTPPDLAVERRRRRLGLAEALRRSGRLQEAMGAFDEAGRRNGDPDADTLVAAALGYEEALFASRLPRDTWGDAGIDLLERAVDVLGSSSAPARARLLDRARLLAALGRAMAYRGQDGSPAAQTAVRLAREAGDDGTLAHALVALRASQTEPDDLSARLSAGRRLVDAAHRSGDAEIEFEGLRLRFVDLLEAGDVARAEETRRRAGDVAARLRQPQYLWYPAMWEAMWALFAGRIDEATDLIERFRHQGRQWHYHDVALVHAVLAMHLHIERAEPEPAREVIEAVRAADPTRWSAVVAFADARRGRLDIAGPTLDRLNASDFTDLPRDLSWAYNLSLLAECAAEVADAAAAEAVARHLEPWVGHAVVLGSGAVCLGSAAYFAGLARATAGDVTGAVSLVVRAVEENRAMGAGPALDRSRRLLERLSGDADA